MGSQIGRFGPRSPVRTMSHSPEVRQECVHPGNLVSRPRTFRECFYNLSGFRNSNWKHFPPPRWHSARMEFRSVLMSLFQRIFLAHPASVNETYSEHMRSATSFAIRMIGGGLACLFHGLVPCCFERTGSNQVHHLYECMVSNRVKSSTPEAHSVAKLPRRR